MVNHIEKLLELHPDKFRDEAYLLSENPNVTIDIIKKYPDFNWDWMTISEREDITWEIVKENLNNPNIQWCWSELSRNPNITWKIIQENIDQPWVWHYVSENKNITIEIIEKNSDMLCYYESLSQNPNITVEFIEKTINESWSFTRLSSNENLTLDFVRNNLNKDWWWSDLLCRKFITCDFIQEIRNSVHSVHIDWYHLTENPNITMEFIKNNLNEEWNWDAISQHPNITWENVVNNPTLSWSWYNLPKNPNITFEIVRNNQDKDWHYADLYENPNMSYNDVTNFLKELNIDIHESWYVNTKQELDFNLIKNRRDGYGSKVYNFQNVSHNINLTWEFIHDNIDEDWDWGALSLNVFNYKPPHVEIDNTCYI